jgi:hypothetical protein
MNSSAITITKELEKVQKNIFYHSKLIVAFVLCGCETWSVTLREEHTFRAIMIFHVHIACYLFTDK